MNMSLFTDFLNLFYPQLCACCNSPLVKGEDVLCLGCLADLPRTHFTDFSTNPVADIFLGRTNIIYGNSFCQFDKGGKVQHLIHQLKYKGKKEIGYRLGFLFGSEMVQCKEFLEIDAIIPVPLHKKKQRKRGYNQSIEICRGICEAMNKPLISGNLIRSKHTSSQTSKGRYERWENVSGIFKVKSTQDFTGKHLLLVDDVITTGATLESCCEELLKIPGTKVSIAAIANA
jgi:ComF family protein